ncbi:hypothetical protein OQA88_10580 [Cercophora sp. LCS_1]
MSPKIVTIVGATGAQGRGVASAFINNPAYHVRAITRSPTSAAAQALASQGAELITANVNSLPSLKTAFAGSSIIYAVTDFFEPFAAHSSPTKAVEIETQQGINLARAALSTISTLEHYIWSTLPSAVNISKGKYNVPHFEGKIAIDQFIQSQPELVKKTTFLWVTWYHSNYTFPMFTPYWIPTAGKYIQFASYAADTPVHTIGDVTRNIAPFVKAIVEQPEKTLGQVVKASSEVFGAEELLQLWARTKGVKAQFVRVSGKDFGQIWPLWADEMGVMMEFWDEYRESWVDTLGRKVVTGEELGVRGLVSVEEAFKTFEFE